MKKIFSVLLALVFIVSVSGCKNNAETDKNLQRIIEENGYDTEIDTSSAEIVTSSTLSEDVEGLRNSENYTLLLVSSKDDSKTVYNICAVDFENEKMALFEYGNSFPLSILKEGYIDTASRRIQQQNFNIVSTYIKEYGFDFTEYPSYADAYIRRITGNNGYIPLSEAQGLIDASLMDTFPNLLTYDSAEAVFEEGSAVITAYQCTTTIDGDEVTIGLDKDFNELYNSIDDGGAIVDDEEYEYDEFRFVDEDEQPEGTEIEEIPDTNETTMYRVRKSANDSSSQLGAFSDYNNAVKLAQSKKSEGYKVFDTNGKLVYTP